ncbi:MAG: FAD-binding oxidoreductase [bacterium]
MLKKTENIDSYLEDVSGIPGGFAEAVYIPENEKEVSEILRDCYGRNIPVTVSGGRTGVTGGSVPFGGVIISTENLKKIYISGKSAVIGAGITLLEIDDALKGGNLFYPPDPTERTASFGGTVSTNASGSRGFSYGRTGDYIISARVVLSDGEILNLKRGRITERNGVMNIYGRKIPCAGFEMPAVKSAAGYFSKKGMDAVDLFTGSEGTLGFICECEVRLIERPVFLTAAVFFKDENVLETVKKLKKSVRGVVSIEYFDRNSILLISGEFPQIPKNSKAAVFIEKTGSEIEELGELLEAVGNAEEILIADNARTLQLFKDIRHRVPEKINETVRRRGFSKIGADFAVGDDEFPAVFRFYKDVLEKSSVEHAVFGHIGESHLHINMIPRDREEYARSKKIYEDLAEKVISLGGTVSAEHGIGKLKREYLRMMYGKGVIEKMRQTKKALDDRFILGRGNILQV